MSSARTNVPHAPTPPRPGTPPVSNPPPIVIDEAMLEAWLTGRPPPTR